MLNLYFAKKDILTNIKDFFSPIITCFILALLMANCDANSHKGMFCKLENNQHKRPKIKQETHLEQQHVNNQKDEKHLEQQNINNQQDKAFKIKVSVVDVDYEVEVIKNMKVGDLVIKLQNLYNKNVNGLYFESSDEYGLLDNNFKLKNYQIREGDYFEAVSNSSNKRATNLINVNSPQIDIAQYQGKKIPVSSYHVSCRSYKPKTFISNENLGGIVLYSYDDKFDWKVNKVHCKTGYIIIKRIDDIKHLKSKHGMVHGNVYKSVFGVELDKKVVGSGFAFKDGKWKFNSFTFNAKKDTFHTNEKAMNNIEEKYVSAAIKNWIEKNQQNIKVEENLEILEVTKMKLTQIDK